MKQRQKPRQAHSCWSVLYRSRLSPDRVTNVIIHHCKPLSAFCHPPAFVTQLATGAAYMLMPSSESASSIHRLDASAELEGRDMSWPFWTQGWKHSVPHLMTEFMFLVSRFFSCGVYFLLPKLSVEQSIWSALESHEIQFSPHIIIIWHISTHSKWDQGLLHISSLSNYGTPNPARITLSNI